MAKTKKINPEVEVLKNQLSRALADYDNLEKRVERQSADLYASASQRIVKQLLPILDMLGDAQKHINDSGLAITIKEFEDVLIRAGYSKVSPEVGSEFDPLKHEVVDVVDTDKQNEDNKVDSVTLVGWDQGESVLRAAKVIVKKYKENNS